jgi:hypothetical protein
MMDRTVPPPLTPEEIELVKQRVKGTPFEDKFYIPGFDVGFPGRIIRNPLMPPPKPATHEGREHGAD